MAKRGRRSAAELGILTALEDRRPLPPDDLTADQADIWLTVVNRLPVGWFPPESWEVLGAYCRHAVAARDLSAIVDAFEVDWITVDGGPERLDRFLKMRDREARAVLAHARALRLTNQSRIDPKAAGRAARDEPLGPRPWEPAQIEHD